jgi:mannosyl-3-phosphoglycerate phosphatase
LIYPITEQLISKMLGIKRENEMDFPLLIFTDLDGTLLDHHSYSFSGAAKALQHLHQYSIPVVLASSKTRAELQRLQQQLGLNEPFIAENGGGVFIPAGYSILDTHALEKMDNYSTKQFGKPYHYIRKIFATVRSKYNIKGFGDMTVEEIMAATGLNKEDALLAGKRDFSEPFLFLSEPLLQELKEEVADHGLKITRGGRFYHLMAAEQDKGYAVAETRRLFQAACPNKFITVGLGDAENDLPMLKTVDIPVLIPKPDGSYENTDMQGLRKSPYPGSKGWGAAIMAILDDYQLAPTKK